MGITLSQVRYCKHRAWLGADDPRCSLLNSADGFLIGDMHPCNDEDCPIPGAFKLRQPSIEDQVNELVRDL